MGGVCDGRVWWGSGRATWWSGGLTQVVSVGPEPGALAGGGPQGHRSP